MFWEKREAAIIGGGIMGADIAVAFAAGGWSVHLAEASDKPRGILPHRFESGMERMKAKGKGTVYSYTVLHYPKFPGYEFPLVCGLIELEEGTRVVTNIGSVAPGDVTIGMPVVLSIENVDDELKLPVFRPAK